MSHRWQRAMQGLHFAVATGVLGVVTWLLLTPDPYAITTVFKPLREVALNDRIMHFLVYGTIAVAVESAGRISGRGTSTLRWLLVSGHAGLTELTQAWIPGRCSDPVDLLANLIGLSVGFALCIATRHRFQNVRFFQAVVGRR